MDHYQKRNHWTGLGSAFAACVLLSACIAETDGEPSIEQIAQPLAAVDNVGIVPAGGHYAGKSLTQWLGLYTAWRATGEPASGAVGNVRFLPMPEGAMLNEDPLTFGGQMDLSIANGTALLAPCLGVTGESYQDGSADPFPVYPQQAFDCHGVTLDGQPLDLSGYYVQDVFDPPVPYAEATDYGAVAATTFQSVGFVALPMSVGEHTLSVQSTLHVTPDFSVSFDNTWNITVRAR